MDFDLDSLNQKDREELNILIEEYKSLKEDEDDIRFSDDQYEDPCVWNALEACENFYKKCLEKKTINET